MCVSGLACGIIWPSLYVICLGFMLRNTPQGRNQAIVPLCLGKERGPVCLRRPWSGLSSGHLEAHLHVGSVPAERDYRQVDCRSGISALRSRC